LAKVLAHLTDLKYYGKDGVSAYKAVVEILDSPSYQGMDVFLKLKMWDGMNYKLATGQWRGKDVKRKAEQFKRSDDTRAKRANDGFSLLSGLTTAAYGLQGTDSGFSAAKAIADSAISPELLESAQEAAKAGSSSARSFLNKRESGFGVKTLGFLTREISSITLAGIKLPISVIGALGIGLSVLQLEGNIIDVWTGSTGSFNCGSTLQKVVGTAIQVTHTTVDVLGGLAAGAYGAFLASEAGPFGAVIGFGIGVVGYLAIDQVTNVFFDRGLMRAIGC
jgi:hypothetical protein